ncbi:hypothetical protein SAMN05518683_11442 [Salibacterium halotolerans]|uniref:Uncharacterized protein n=1 Tax=Salibacterium halotolerans TaxID=1884432 RepID=A0A1I5USY0_9BACI|nr:hypothetical protein SAMN05518683_11442 [Salibacterium halotolerans]
MEMVFIKMTDRAELAAAAFDVPAALKIEADWSGS